jgi:hypothetical protein
METWKSRKKNFKTKSSQPTEDEINYYNESS